MFVEQLYSLVIGLAGQEVSEGKPDRAHQLLLNQSARRFLTESLPRMKTLLRDLFAARETFFHPYFLLDENAFSDKTVALLLERFPLSPSEKQIENNWKEFQDLKIFCRNVVGPQYDKVKSKKNPSGTYTDTDALIEIHRNVHIALIDENEVKAINRKLGEFKKAEKEADRPMTTNDLVEKRNELKDQVSDKYERQRIDCMTNRNPASQFVAFLILGAPGLNLSYLNVTMAASAVVKSKAARQGEGREVTTTSSNGELTQMLAVKTVEANVKVTAVNNALLESRKRNIENLLTDLQDSPNCDQHADEIAVLRKKRREILRNIAGTSPVKVAPVAPLTLWDLTREGGDFAQRTPSFATSSTDSRQ